MDEKYDAVKNVLVEPFNGYYKAFVCPSFGLVKYFSYEGINVANKDIMHNMMHEVFHQSQYQVNYCVDIDSMFLDNGRYFCFVKK